MKLCRFTLTPLSPWTCWLASDTLYGLVCWHVAENEGDAACSTLIEAFCANQAPFQLSSAMPANYLPMPILPPLSRARFRDLAKEADTDSISLFDLLKRFKKFRKTQWLATSAWQKRKGELSLAALFRDQPESEEKLPALSITAFEPHVSIDRATGTALAGQLFFTRLRYFANDAKLHLYARTDDSSWLLKYLIRIGDAGFGQNSSTGNGRFAVELDTEFEPDAWEVPDANAFLLCSTCAAPDMSALSGFYKLEVKRGKTGPGHANPFKKPFLLLQAGSVLQKELPGPFVLRGINADSRIVQILQPLNLPCRLAEAL